MAPQPPAPWRLPAQPPNSVAAPDVETKRFQARMLNAKRGYGDQHPSCTQCLRAKKLSTGYLQPAKGVQSDDLVKLAPKPLPLPQEQSSSGPRAPVQQRSHVRCCCGRLYHRRCPVKAHPQYRDFLYLLACVGQEPIPGHLIFRGAFPTPLWNQERNSKGDWIFPLPDFITNSTMLEKMLPVSVRFIVFLLWPQSTPLRDGCPWEPVSGETSRSRTNIPGCRCFTVRLIPCDSPVERGTHCSSSAVAAVSTLLAPDRRGPSKAAIICCPPTNAASFMPHPTRKTDLEIPPATDRSAPTRSLE
ncbi:hypothetical protein BR93DRAFT_275098 [Coniochaeta sp. PMI_546]|nr:hypothetical protein BR93DRAFT_275098 [Coniochaeta sp. PMI_546]